MPKKQERRYCLCVELIIDGKKEIICLAKYDLITLQKYTSFCSGASELLKFMPEDDLISTKDYILENLKDSSMKEDPFSIRGTDSFHSKKIPILYKKDEDILLYNKQEIIDCIKRKYFINLSDVENGTIDDKAKEFFASIWDKYSSDETEKTLYWIVEKKLDCDKPESYDSRYGKILNNKWMLLGVSGKFLSYLIDNVWDDTKKRLEFINLLKSYDNNLLPQINYEERRKRISLLEEQLNKKGITVHRIRRRIMKNIKPLVPQKQEIKPVINVITETITERQILDYNKERKGKKGPIFDEILYLSEKLERLNSELLVTHNVAMKKDLEKEKEELEYKIYELENNKYFYSDSGELIKEDKMYK